MRPGCEPLYDEAEFIIRNVIRYYGGWWTGRPSELKPSPRDAVAREFAAIAGGARALAERAGRLAASGELAHRVPSRRLCARSRPRRCGCARVVAALYEQRAAGESSLMARNLFRAAAAYAREGRPFA